MRNTLILALFFLFSLSMMAEERTKNELCQLAKNALIDNHVVTHQQPRRAVRAKEDDERNDDAQPTLTVLYEMEHLAVVGFADGGYAIISKDSEHEPLWGYSSSNFDAENMVPAFKFMLERMNEQLAKPAAKSSRRRLPDASLPSEVQPLIKTQWNQYAPYNNLCPTTNGEHCITGCTATALAQVVNYYRTPSVGKGVKTYSYTDDHDDQQTITMDFSVLSFDFDQMISNYESSSYTPKQASAVARLMYACGVLCEAQYGRYETWAGIHPDNIKQYFGYNVSYCLFNPTHSLLYDYLSRNMPLLLHSSSENHILVLDGYDTNGLYHLNYGWGGDADGYYSLCYDDGTLNTNNYYFQVVFTNTEFLSEGCLYRYNSKSGDLYLDNVYADEEGNAYLPDITIPYTHIIEGTERVADITDAHINAKGISTLTLGEGHTAILKDFCTGETEIDTLVLPASLERMEYYAITGARSINHLKCYATTPPALASWSMSYGDITVYVPEESLDLYRKAEGWKKCKLILPFGGQVECTVDDIHYVLDREKQTAKVVGTDLHYVVDVPDNIIYNGKSYTVTTIARHAFHSETLGAITLPTTLESIEDEAFNGCKNLTSLTFQNGNTPLNSMWFFNAELSKLTVFVPYEYLQDYSNSWLKQWLKAVVAYDEPEKVVEHVYDPAPSHIVVFTNDGEKNYYKLNNTSVLTFSANNLLVEGSGSDDSYSIGNIQKIVYGDIITAIAHEEITADGTFACKDAALEFSAGESDLNVRIVSLAGIVIRQFRVDAGTRYTLPLNQLRTGVYVIDVNGQTSKITVR